MKSIESVADFLGVKEHKHGIMWCINCVGMHPSDQPAIEDFYQRLVDPQKTVLRKHAQTARLLNEYSNKSCMMCGRSYNSNGEVDETWKTTAKRVKDEFDNAGVFGVSDKNIEVVVAQCRKSFTTLLANRYRIPKERWQYLTFSGQLAYIITVAQENRKIKLENAGMVKL